MFHHPLFSLFRQWKSIGVIAVVVTAASIGATLLFPLQYRADAQVLVLSTSRSADPFTNVKSAERIGENLAQVMETNDFYAKVKASSGALVDWNYFERFEERKKRKRWQKDIEGSVVFGTSVLNISAFHKDAAQATALAAAAADTLAQGGWQYVGRDVTISLVNSAIATKFPVKPNILLNAVLGVIVGVLGGAVVAGYKS